MTILEFMGDRKDNLTANFRVMLSSQRNIFLWRADSVDYRSRSWLEVSPVTTRSVNGAKIVSILSWRGSEDDQQDVEVEYESPRTLI
jgi:hypothetical protein